MLTSHSFTAYPIKKVPWKGFSEAVKKVKITVGNKTRDVAVQRDILELLLTTSFKEGVLDTNGKLQKATFSMLYRPTMKKQIHRFATFFNTPFD